VWNARRRELEGRLRLVAPLVCGGGFIHQTWMDRAKRGGPCRWAQGRSQINRWRAKTDVAVVRTVERFVHALTRGGQLRSSGTNAQPVVAESLAHQHIFFGNCSGLCAPGAEPSLGRWQRCTRSQHTLQRQRRLNGRGAGGVEAAQTRQPGGIRKDRLTAFGQAQAIGAGDASRAHRAHHPSHGESPRRPAQGG